MEAIIMKVLRVVAKIVLALAAIAGVVYLAATYGDRIVAWCKNFLGRNCCCDCDCDYDCDCDCCCEESAEISEEATSAESATEADFEG